MSDEINKYIERLPDPSQEIANDVWGTLPSDMRQELSSTFGAITKIATRNPLVFSDIVRLIKRNYDPALNPLSSIAVVGPVNVGKSTLFNALQAGTSANAEVSPVPGTTKTAQTADIGMFSIVDTPGLDHGSNDGVQEKDIAFNNAQYADFLLIVFDASRSVTESDKRLYQHLVSFQKPTLVVLNKIDLVQKSHHQAVHQAASDVLQLAPEKIQLISAEKQQNIQHLILEIAAAEPRLIGEIGKIMTPLRSKLGWQAIRRAAIAACLIALTPMPVLDIIPLTALQGSLVLTLARIYDRTMNFGRAMELLASFGVGMAARTLFQQISKMGGPPGWALSASIAGATTIVIGYVVMMWFETGNMPSPAEVRQKVSNVQKNLIAIVKSFTLKKRPTKEHLTEELDKMLPDVTKTLEKNES